MIALMKRILNVAGGYKGRIQLAFVFSFLKSLLAKAPIGMAFLVLTAFLDGSAGSRLCLTMGAAMAICLVLQVLCQHADGAGGAPAEAAHGLLYRGEHRKNQLCTLHRHGVY